MEHYIIKLHCHICNAEIGEASVPSKHWTAEEATEENYNTRTKTVDNRCTQCESDHGSYKELEAEYRKKTGEDGNAAEAFIKANRKRSDFDREIAKKGDKIKP